MFDHLFNGDRIARLPPERYQFRVLKLLMAKIEKAIVDPEQDVRIINGGTCSTQSSLRSPSDIDCRCRRYQMNLCLTYQP